MNIQTNYMCKLYFLFGSDLIVSKQERGFGMWIQAWINKDLGLYFQSRSQMSKQVREEV